MKLLCSLCNAAPARRNQRYCEECHSAYMRRWRQVKAAELKGLKARQPIGPSTPSEILSRRMNGKAMA